MRYLSALSLLAAAATASARNKWAPSDTDWATEPAETADWYEQNDQRRPAIASAVTTVAEGQSYMVKLDCVGCPFRVRPNYPDMRETWQDPAQETSLVRGVLVPYIAQS